MDKARKRKQWQAESHEERQAGERELEKLSGADPLIPLQAARNRLVHTQIISSPDGPSIRTLHTSYCLWMERSTTHHGFSIWTALYASVCLCSAGGAGGSDLENMSIHTHMPRACLGGCNNNPTTPSNPLGKGVILCHPANATDVGQIVFQYTVASRKQMDLSTHDETFNTRRRCSLHLCLHSPRSSVNGSSVICVPIAQLLIKGSPAVAP